MLYVSEGDYFFDTSVRGYYWSPLYYFIPETILYYKITFTTVETYHDNDISSIIRLYLNLLIKRVNEIQLYQCYQNDTFPFCFRPGEGHLNISHIWILLKYLVTS